MLLNNVNNLRVFDTCILHDTLRTDKKEQSNLYLFKLKSK